MNHIPPCASEASARLSSYKYLLHSCFSEQIVYFCLNFSYNFDLQKITYNGRKRHLQWT
ncbi:MAG: hypothetical protein U5L45_17130 [Saprospiraceae bacterium]|nr:hypothetical protein [Saprospiraceae bacterium]